MKKAVLLIALLFMAPQFVFAANYKIDVDHSTVSFKVRHLFSNVQGFFRQFEGTLVYDPEKPESWSVKAVVQAASIDTNVKQRDEHLRGADFFDVEKFPTLSFTSTQITDATKTSAKLTGALSIHGVEKPVVFDLQILGTDKDPWGNVVSGFTATTTINRKDFGLTWNKTVESGGVLVGEEVVITLEIAAILQP